MTGRPMKYDNEKSLSEDIDAFFSECVVEEKPPTISGLAYHLDISTECLRNYGTKEIFSATVKRAKQRVEICLEQRLDAAAPVGAIFNLKNNFGWKDKTEQEHSGGISVERIERVLVDPANTNS